MNRNAIALAADSAGTLLLPTGAKVNSTENKLFMLCTSAPVGIMFYGASQLMGVPWETIVAAYSRDLNARRFDHLEDYAGDFLHFLERDDLLFPGELQRAYAESCVEGGFRQLRDNVEEEVARVISNSDAIDDLQVEDLTRKQCCRFLSDVEREEYLVGFGVEDVDRLAREFAAIIENALRNVFQKLPITACRKQLQRAAALMLCNKYPLDLDIAGVVIAGFGERDFFPALFHYECDGVINGKLRYTKASESRIGHDFTGEADGTIRAFAQHEMVDRFMEGIDPQYREFVDYQLSRILLKEYPQLIESTLSGKISPDDQKGLSAQLASKAEEVRNRFWETVSEFQQGQFVEGVTGMVATLTKPDLAAMAEALVNFTVLKRRVSEEPETVSPPIDVAVISKAEGFVWIKKKQYFEASLNPHAVRS